MKRYGRWAILAAALALAGTAPAQRAVDPPRDSGKPSTMPGSGGGGIPRAGGTAPAAAPASGGSVYAKRDGTAIRSGPDRKDPVVAEVAGGEELQVLEREMTRLKVKTKAGVVGYVSSLNIANSPPKAAEVAKLSVKDDLGSGERSNVTSVRGLSPIAEALANDPSMKQTAVEDAKRMEAVAASVSDADVSSFLSEGGVTPP